MTFSLLLFLIISRAFITHNHRKNNIIALDSISIWNSQLFIFMLCRSLKNEATAVHMKERKITHPPSLGCKFEALVITWIQNSMDVRVSMLHKFLVIAQNCRLLSPIWNEHFACDNHNATEQFSYFYEKILPRHNISNIHSATIAQKTTKHNWRLHYPALSPRFERGFGVGCKHANRGPLWSRTQIDACDNHYATEKYEWGIRSQI